MTRFKTKSDNLSTVEIIKYNVGIKIVYQMTNNYTLLLAI